MSDAAEPSSEAELAAVVREAADAATPLAIRGGGTRSGLGRPVQAARTLSTRGLSGIKAYEPAEMVMTARAGTPVAEIEAALAEHRQRMAFEPMDHRPIYGTDGEPTIGGVAAVNASGPRRFVAGAARDAMLGLRFVNGRGEAIQAGGRVMKNVTGLDLVKLLCGSFGRLGVMSEVTFKVAPVPETQTTLVMQLDVEDAVRAMAAAMATSAGVSGAARLPDGRTLLRLEGFASSVKERAAKLDAALAPFGTLKRLSEEASREVWQGIRDARPFADGSDDPLWRISVAPSAAPGLLAAVAKLAAHDVMLDWQGGLIWLAPREALDAHALREEIAIQGGNQGGGHATLVRAPHAVRAAGGVFQPQAEAVAKVSERLRERFDPAGVFASRTG